MPRILIIDDEPAIRDLLVEVFRDAGFEVAWAESGIDGVRLCGEQKPDLVVTDMLMPGKDGVETILELRRSAPGLPVIAISGGSARSPIDLLAMARRFGAVRVYRKPFDPFQLLADAKTVLSAA